MRVRLFFVPVLLFAIASSGLAQVDRPTIRNNADAPLQITEAHCGQSAQASTGGLPHGNYYYCHATIQFADTEETWDGYGLLWTVTYQDGSKNPVYTSSDRSVEPTGRPDGSLQPSGRFFKPREISAVGRPGAGFSKMDRNGKELSVTGAEVEVDFVINTNGTVWGNSKSPVLKNLLEQRKQAKEGTQEKTSATPAPKP